MKYFTILPAGMRLSWRVVRIVSRTLLCPVLSFCLLIPASAQRREILVEVKDMQMAGTAAGPASAYLNGYASTIDGGTITYHSSHPDAEEALLCRAKSGSNRISWISDTLTTGSPGDFHNLVWLAGIERIGWGNDSVPRTFEFFVDDEKWFTFTNRKDSTAGEWTVSGRGGARLSFRSLTKDKFGDLFGHMFLDLPKKIFPAGRALRFSIEAEDAGSPEWVMVFRHRFNFLPRVRVEPALVRGAEGDRALLRLSLDNLRAGRTVSVSHGDSLIAESTLGIGANIFLIPTGAVLNEEKQQVVFEVNGVQEGKLSTTVSPVRKMSIHLVPHTHTDIGYTDLQDIVEETQWRHLDEALALIKSTQSYPPEARFKWNLEVLWPFETYMRRASAARRDEILEAVRTGGIGLNALLVNPLTGLANAPEMSHYLDYARLFTSQTALPIATAAISDIPGFSWGIVTALAQSGVRYFASAPNSGDRIGYVLERWGDRPFYWTSQSGEEKVLLWVAGSSYALFHQETLPLAGPEKLMKLLRKLEDTGYPYGIYYLPYTLGDNAGPDPDLSDFVRGWNEKYVSPRLVISTHQQLFGEFEGRYGQSLPVRSGDFTPYWEDGAISTAKETAVNRSAVDRLIQGETIWSIRSPSRFPDSLYDDAWRKVSLFDEHTWGADISVSDPDDPEVLGQWAIKRQFALDAAALAQRLLRQAISVSGDWEPPSPGPVRPPPGRGQAFDVWNTCSWPRTDVAYLPPAGYGYGDIVIDSEGRRMISQQLTGGSVAVLMKNVPPLSGARLFTSSAEGTPSGTTEMPETSPVEVFNHTLENEFVRLEVNPGTGTIGSLLDKMTGVEYAAGSGGLNRYVYVPGTNPDSARYPENVSITIKEKGPLVGSLLVEADAPGCRAYTSEIRLVAGIPRVEIINTIDKLAVREKEGVHFAFPFRIPGGTLRYDVANGIVDPVKDQLDGACRNFFSVQSWVDLSHPASRGSGDRPAAGYGVTWATADAPLIEIGEITAEAPWMKSISDSSGIYSYVMNNYWHTNYKADQEGRVVFRYAISPHGEFHAAGAAKRGREIRRPLIVSAGTGNLPPGESPFGIRPDDVLIESIRPLEGGRSWLLSLYNPSNFARQVTLEGRDGLAVWKSDAFGKSVTDTGGGFLLPGFGSTYLRLEQR